MAEEVVEVVVSPDGKVSINVSGIPGMGCTTETQDLERLLGGNVVARELTSEAYQDTAAAQQDRLWQ